MLQEHFSKHLPHKMDSCNFSSADSLWLCLALPLSLAHSLALSLVCSFYFFVFWCVVGVWIVWLCRDGRCEACQLLMAPLSGALTTSNKNSMSRDVGQLWHAPAFVCATHVQTSRKLRNVVESCANIGKVKNLWINLNLRIWEQKENSLENSNFVENTFFLSILQLWLVVASVVSESLCQSLHHSADQPVAASLLQSRCQCNASSKQCSCHFGQSDFKHVWLFSMSL